MNDMNTLDVPSETPVKDEPTYGNGQNGDVGQSWNVEQADENQSGQYNDAQMEQDLPPIGIKEDG